MVGTNYMGGKRNTARTKSKDVVGRAQRRHFGKQRLASALCATQENRVHTSAPTLSFLPEITLAHARRDASTDSGATSSRKVTTGDRLYSSTSLSNMTQRNKPSKVLGALDTSDQDTSMRAAIDRILKQPTLVGINAPKLTETVPVERMQTPIAARRSTQAHLTSKDPDTQYLKTVSKYAFDSLVTCPEIPRHEHKGLHEPNPNLRYWPTEGGVLSLPDSISRMRDVTSWNTVDDSEYTEAQLLTGVNPFFRTEDNEPDRSNAFPDSVYPLPQSSPFPSSSQSSDNSILDLDTSPLAAIRFGRPDDLSEEDNDRMDTTKLRSIPRPIFRQSSQSFSIREGSASVDEAQSTISSFTNSDEEELEAERSRKTCCNNNLASPSTINHDFGHSFPSGHNTMEVLTSQEVNEDDAPSRISTDFLSDPHPWETIGRILKLKPPGPSAAQSVTVSFTKDREGVGFVSLERSDDCNARPSDATSFETRINDQSTDDIHVVSSADPPILEIVDLEVPNADDRMAVDAPESPCANNSTRLLLDAGSPSTTQGEVDPCTHVHALQESPLIPVIHCTQNQHSQSSSPFTIIVGTTTAEPDVDMMFAGPCLFGDSDLEEDE